EPAPVPAAPAPAAPAPAAPAPAAPAPAAPARSSGGFLAALQGLLPKPVLFGLYGALGALLGLLVLGELLFALLHPPKKKPEVSVTAPEELVVFPGSENKLTVKIARHWFK